MKINKFKFISKIINKIISDMLYNNYMLYLKFLVAGKKA